VSKGAMMFEGTNYYVENYLKVDTEISQNQTPDPKYPTIIKFTITNIFKHQEFETDVVFE
jgi:hypothetical protein